MCEADGLGGWLGPAELIALSNAVDAVDDFILGELADRYMTGLEPNEGQFTTLYLLVGARNSVVSL